jgi:hypothetical protein
MKKSLQLSALIVSGLLASLFILNFLVHLIFYILDGSIVKFTSPMWIGLNGVMILLVGIFVWAEKKFGIAQS